MLQFAKKPRHPGMILAGISVQIRLRLKTYRSGGGVKMHRLNDYGYIARKQRDRIPQCIG